MKRPLIPLVLALALVVTPGNGADEMSLRDEGRRLTAAFFAGDLDGIWLRFTPEMKGVLKSREELRLFRDGASAQLGAETKVLEETVDEFFRTYLRVSQFERAQGPVVTIWTLDAEGRIAGFRIRPQAKVPAEAPSPYLAYLAKTALELPFRGEWTVVWGGRTLKQNHHAAAVDQRFAYDILVVKDGSSHAAEGRRNEDYYAFGREILAPGAGTVVSSANDLPDNAPGVMDREHPLGNHVILDHGNGEWSFLAHLKNGSVRVKAGDHVAAGALVGLCGNSGNTTEPHLHYHLQDSAVPFGGKGLPPAFRDYTADGKPVAKGEPVKGERIARAAGR